MSSQRQLNDYREKARTTDRNLDPDAAAVRMQRLGRLKSYNGAETVVITGDDASSPCNLAAYIMKAATLAKSREFCATSPCGFNFIKTKLPPIAAARLTEVLSGIYFDELLLSGGDGKSIRTHLRRLVRSSLSDRSHHNISIEQAQRFWTQLRSRGPLRRYPAVAVERSFGQLDLHSPALPHPQARYPILADQLAYGSFSFVYTPHTGCEIA